MLLANVRDGGDLEKVAALSLLAVELGAIVGKFGSATIESGARLWLTYGDDNVRMEYPSDTGEELVDVTVPNYDPIHPKEVSETHRQHVLRRLPKEAKKLLRLWQKVVEEEDKEKKGK